MRFKYTSRPRYEVQWCSKIHQVLFMSIFGVIINKFWLLSPQTNLKENNAIEIVKRKHCIIILHSFHLHHNTNIYSIMSALHYIYIYISFFNMTKICNFVWFEMMNVFKVKKAYILVLFFIKPCMHLKCRVFTLWTLYCS